MSLKNFFSKFFLFFFNSFPVTTTENALIDDDALRAFLKGPEHFEQFYTANALVLDQDKEMLAQKLEAHLVALHSMRWHWHCYQIGKKFKGNEKKKCQKYLVYVRSIYYYLLAMFANFPAPVKPDFVLKKQKFVRAGTLCDVINSLYRIWRFYFDPEFGKSKQYKLDKLFTVYYKPKLKPGTELDYGNLDIHTSKKVPIWIKFDKKLKAMVADDEFVAFIKEGMDSKQFFLKSRDEKDGLAHKYDAHLGTLYLMRTGWHCANIGQTFGQNERRECQKYRTYLDTLYEYLFRMFAGVPTIKPTFTLKKNEQQRHEREAEEMEENGDNDGAMIEVIDSLEKIAKFFFVLKWGKRNEFKLEKLFSTCDEPKLLNEEKKKKDTPNWNNSKAKKEKEKKGPSNLDNAKNEKDPSSLDNAKIRQKFDKKMEAIVDDDEFIGFVKELPKFEQQMQQQFDCYHHQSEAESSNKLGGRKWDKTNGGADADQVNGSGTRMLLRYDSHFYAANLGVLYLMRRKWNCAKIVQSLEEGHRHKECLKYRKHLYILYEYLFRIYAQAIAANPRLLAVGHLRAVKPLFEFKMQRQSLADIVYRLNTISMLLFDAEFVENHGHKLEALFIGPKLINAKELADYYHSYAEGGKGDEDEEEGRVGEGGEAGKVRRASTSNNNNRPRNGNKWSANAKNGGGRRKSAVGTALNRQQSLTYWEEVMEAKARQQFDNAMKRISQAASSKFEKPSGHVGGPGAVAVGPSAVVVGC